MRDNIDIDWILQKDNFMQTYANKGIEIEDIELIYESIMKPMDDMDKHKKYSEEIKINLEKCPTLEELKEAIKKAKKGKAGDQLD